MKSAIVCGLAAAACAFAQLELKTMPDRTAYAAGSTVSLGTAAVGDRAVFVFRVTNTDIAPVTISKVDVKGVGFWILDPPLLPGTLLSRAWVEFHVSLEPDAPGGYLGTLLVNDTKWLLAARAESAVSVSLESDGSPLVSGSEIEFGTVRVGETVTKHFVLANPAEEALRVEQVTVTGNGFAGPAGIAPPLTVDPKQSAAFDVVLAPGTAGACEGTLTVDSRTFRLVGTAVDPPLPAFQIGVEPAALHSGQQASLRLKFDSKSPAKSSGLLTMDFIGKGDPSVTLLNGGGRSVPFEIRAGEDTARFGEDAFIGFQTGTTEGEIIFTATLGTEVEKLSVQIGAEAVSVDSVRVTRGSASLLVALTGFDNTRSASAAAYTFYDKSGKVIGNRAILADVTNVFTDYFKNTETGGAFVLRALFPVTGGTSAIDSLDVELTNSVGVSSGHVKIAE